MSLSAMLACLAGLGSLACSADQTGGPAIGPAPLNHAIAAGMAHTCVVRSQGGLVCWGANNHGELGTGSRGLPSDPVVATAAGDDIVEVAANSFQTCVRRARGAVACWGSNAEGGLGDGTLDDRVVPTPVLDIDDAAEIAAGGLSACVRRRDGTVSCWGAYHTFEPSQGSLRPVTVAGLADVVEIRTSQPGGKYCARTGSNQILCWNVDGNVPAPTAIPELSGARALAVSVLSVCTLTDSRDVLCVNQPGMETSLREGVSDAVEIAGGSTHVCWRRATGTVRCWDSAGVLFGSASPTSGDLASDATAVEITAGQIHVCARLADDGIACFNDPGSPPGVGNPTLVRVPNLPP